MSLVAQSWGTATWRAVFQQFLLVYSMACRPDKVPGGIQKRRNAVTQVSIWSPCWAACPFWKEAGKIAKGRIPLSGSMYRPSVPLEPAVERTGVALDVRAIPFIDSPDLSFSLHVHQALIGLMTFVWSRIPHALSPMLLEKDSSGDKCSWWKIVLLLLLENVWESFDCGFLLFGDDFYFNISESFCGSGPECDWLPGDMSCNLSNIVVRKHS